MKISRTNPELIIIAAVTIMCIVGSVIISIANQ
jgi:hypothetical protein